MSEAAKQFVNRPLLPSGKSAKQPTRHYAMQPCNVFYVFFFLMKISVEIRPLPRIACIIGLNDLLWLRCLTNKVHKYTHTHFMHIQV